MRGSIRSCTLTGVADGLKWIRIEEEAGIIRSMSKKGCSPDNAACEGFFGRMKLEMYYGRDWSGVSLDEFMQAVDDYLVWFCTGKITWAT